MGFYTTQKMPHGKVYDLQARRSAIKISMDAALEMDANTTGIICVVDNGPFEAAGWAFSNLELRRFCRMDDPRPRTYLKMRNRTEAMWECGMEEDPLDDPAFFEHLAPMGHV